MGKRAKYGDWALYRRLFHEARPYMGRILGLLLLSLLAAPIALALPLPVKVIVDHVLGDAPYPPILEAVLPASIASDPSALLLVASITVVVLAALMQVQYLIAWTLETWIGQKLILDFRAKLLHHLQRLSLSFHDSQSVSDSIYRLQFDAPSIQSVAVEGLIPFATALMKVLVLLYATIRIDWVLALVAIGALPFLALLTEVYRKLLRRKWAEVREKESSAMGVAQEALGALRVVKAFGQEDRESSRWHVRAEAGLRAAIRAVMAHGTFDLLVGLVNGSVAAAILYLGARHVQDGVITLGELVLVIAYLSQMFHPLRELGTRVANLQKALASAERVFALLDAPREAAEKPNARAIVRAEGGFTFRGVTFGYVPEHPVLRGIDLEVPAGARVGIAGRTGSGKSTLLSLLPRFYDPTEGAILLDGTDLRDCRLVDLRRQFAIVLQDTVLFSTTIRDNIAYGRPESSQAEIEAAAHNAAAHEFITNLPDGYDTQVGERGMKLSGGERQRVALARAFLCDAPVLILDEPTSALDTGTETQVMDAVERLMEGRTTFVIAHRLSTLEGCDLRLQLTEGRVDVRSDASGMDFDP